MSEQNPPRQIQPDAQSSQSGFPTAANLTAAEKSMMRRLTEVLQFADFMALLMVAATAFSAYAAWRTAQVTSRIFALEERPFIGIESVTFEQGDTPNPRAVVQYRNFGKIPASGSIITVTALAGGRRVTDAPDAMSSVSAGMLSPGVPHFFYNYFPPATYKAVVAGKLTLMLEVHAEYKGPSGATFCYTERVVFDYRSAGFRPAGGTDRCKNSDVF
jgi:hypothetical protein